jgi:3-oxoadipate enol-lactonase
MRMPDLELNSGMNLHYLDENRVSQRNVVLIHGLGANSDSWQLQTPSLIEAGFRTIIPDVPGFGKSTYPGGSSNIAKLTGYIAHLLDCLGIRETSVIGISMGGTLALQMALDQSFCIDKLVLVNTFARLNTTGIQQLPYYLQRLILLYAIGMPAQARAVAHRLFPYPEQEQLRQELISQILQADPRGYRSTLLALARFNVVDRLSEINLPTLVISGEADTTVPLENQLQLVSGIPNANHKIISKAGHAVTVEQPEIFNQIILEFLR